MLLQSKKSKIMFKFKSFHHKIFEKALNKILKKIFFLNLLSSQFISLPIKRQRFVVLRSPHIDKKSREHFEIRHHTKLLIIQYDSKNIFELSKINLLITFIKNSCSGCNLKIVFVNK